ncbi:MAG: hypothetical protein HQL68_08315 [Magnetococcales bacterium]|nr:hypothetical protein [Magnetococcales bacterium]
MRFKSFVFCIVIFLLTSLSCSPGLRNIPSASAKFIEISLRTSSGAKIEGGFVGGKYKKAVILIPEMSLPKESWYEFAKVLHEFGFSVLLIEGNAISAALNFLINKGVEEINLIGAGLGGEVILDALQKPISRRIKRMVVISPYEPVHVNNDFVRKFFVMSKNDWQVPIDDVVAAYNNTAEPKQMKIYPGSAHGQSFFESKHSKELVGIILNFLTT